MFLIKIVIYSHVKNQTLIHLNEISVEMKLVVILVIRFIFSLKS